MTNRWISYLHYLKQTDVINGFVILMAAGIITFGFILSYSPFSSLRKLSGTFYWVFIMILFLSTLAILTFFQYGSVG
jgi:hypothetical protein